MCTCAMLHESMGQKFRELERKKGLEKTREDCVGLQEAKRLAMDYVQNHEKPMGYSVVVWKKIDPQRSGTIRKCGLVGVGMTLLEEVSL